MHDYDRAPAQSIVDDLGFAENRERVRSIGALQCEAENHRARLKPVIADKHILGSLAFARQALTNLFVLGSDAVCVTGLCDRTSERHMGTIGVEWHPRPARLD